MKITFKCLAAFVAAAACLPSYTAAQEPPELTTQSMDISIRFITPDIVMVSKTPADNTAAPDKNLVVVKGPAASCPLAPMFSILPKSPGTTSKYAYIPEPTAPSPYMRTIGSTNYWLSAIWHPKEAFEQVAGYARP